MRPLVRACFEFARAAWHRRLPEAVLEMALTVEEMALEAGDFEEARAVWTWWVVRWARGRLYAKRRAAGFSEITIGVELEQMRARVRREIGELTRLRLEERRRRL